MEIKSIYPFDFGSYIIFMGFWSLSLIKFAEMRIEKSPSFSRSKFGGETKGCYLKIISIFHENIQQGIIMEKTLSNLESSLKFSFEEDRSYLFLELSAE